MENIKVVPNPYIATNLMEEAINNPNLNQRRKSCLLIYLEDVQFVYIQFLVY